MLGASRCRPPKKRRKMLAPGRRERLDGQDTFKARAFGLLGQIQVGEFMNGDVLGLLLEHRDWIPGLERAFLEDSRIESRFATVEKPHNDVIPLEFCGQFKTW